MKEKGIDELFYAVRHLKKENENFVLDLVGFLKMNTKEQVKDWKNTASPISTAFSRIHVRFT